MKLQELAAKPIKHYSRVLETYFNTQVDFSRVSRSKARTMLSRVRSLISEHNQSLDRHFSERDPNYLKLVMLEQALSTQIKEQTPVMPTDQQKQQAAQITQTIATTRDPKMRAALQKAARGQNLTPDEQKIVSAAALMKTEGTLKRAYKVIKESEVQQAQVVLAAQDMVDKIQAMIEDTTEMQFKELPALVDSIRNQIGMDQAVQFQQDATAALSGLVQSLQGTKTNLEQGLGVVTGQAQATPALDAAMSAGEPGADMDMPAAGGEEEVDLSLDANLSGEEPTDTEEPAQGTRGALGRGRR